MSARPTGRPTGRLAVVARAARARLRRGGRRAALALILLVAGVAAWAGAIAGAPALASGERSTEGGSSPGGAQASPTATSNCPSPNPPNQLTLVAGTPQTTTLGAAFASGLQVALTNSDDCAVTGAAGVPVTFAAPAAGASGRFSASDSNTVTVGADASGTVAAPTFTAGASAGSYTVTASSPYGSVSFSLTNTAAGIPARLVAIPLERRSARVGSRFPRPLQVRVLDASGNPVAGATVTFTLDSSGDGAGNCGASAAAGAAFAAQATATQSTASQATATTSAGGLATSPAFTASTAAGSFTATASVASGGGGGGETESAGKSGDPTVTPVGFSLEDLAGRPAKIAPGVGSTQSTVAGTAFPVRLAVTVTDADKNPVAGALVRFSAPTAGASGRFKLRSRGSRRQRARISDTHMVEVKTGACGIAVAPPFTAGRRPGGYVVEASAKPARPAAFALVDEAP
jgi:protocatechuate 3,4-dioxygenase beta subunit